jgi:TetR/AcrR family transcriptional regulator, tetracycline repressor protein
MARDGTGRTQQRGFLSRDLIVREALALLREDGAGALSMRRLADRLGVAPNALYTHVRGKADLVDGLIDQVYAGLELDPDPAGDWPEQLAAISRDVRAQLLAHPAVVPLALQQPGLGPNSLRLGEAPSTGSCGRPGSPTSRGRHRLRDADLHPRVRGPGDPPGRHRPPDQRRVRPPPPRLLRRPAGGRVPPHRRARSLLARISTEDQFEFGIRICLETQRPGQAPG